MMDLNDKTIFLAGSTGLAGTAILQQLLHSYPRTRIQAAYHKTEPFIRDERITYVKGDLVSPEDCRRMVRSCDYAILSAAVTAGAAGSASAPWRQVSDNVVMNTVLLQALHEEQVKRVVFISSASLYQEMTGYIREEDLDLNKDPHAAFLGVGWVMRFLEKLCSFWHQQGMEIVIARTANIFGPCSRFDPATSNFIPALIRKAVDRMDPFVVWGSPDVTRDVIYVEDFARAILMMLAKEDIKFDVFNVGSGVKTTVGDVVGWALKYAGYTPSSVVYNGQGPSTVPFRALDCAKARNILGWKPEHKVEEGVRRTVEWWTENRGRWTR